MGNTFTNTIQYLRDPALVRKFQEQCGVQEVLMDNSLAPVPENETDTELDEDDPVLNSAAEEVSKSSQSQKSTSGDSSLFQRGHIRQSSSDIAEWLRRKTKLRHRIKSSSSPGHSRNSSLDIGHSRNSSLDIGHSRNSSLDIGHSRTSSLDTEIDPTSVNPMQVEVIVESYPFLDIYFRLASECGYEPFYITLIPFLFWNVDGTLAYTAVVLWGMSMYVGQACKQLFAWKRPANPPAFRLEQNPSLETEYGFPSTHAVVSTVMPFYFLYGTYGRYEYPFWCGLVLASHWTLSVCISRVYLGVHSVLDVIGGVLLSVVLLIIAVPNMDYVNSFLKNSDYTFILALFWSVFLVYIYPINPDHWSVDRGDTAAMLGASTGVVLGIWYAGGHPDDLLTGPFVLEVPSIQCISLSIVRFIVGVLVLLPTRFVMKLLCFKLLPVLMPTHGVKEVVHRPLVELPYKIITYTAIGFNATYFAPLIFEICGISRIEN